MIANFVAAALSFVLLGITFVPLERAFPARPGQPILRPAWVTDLCFFLGQYAVWTGVSIGALAWVEGNLGAPVTMRIAHALGGTPVWLRAVLAVVLGDVSVYWFHRACHRFEWLWKFHAVHHSAEHLDWLAAHREHPVDGIATQMLQNLPAFLIGFPVDTIAGLVAFRGLWAIFVHSNAKLPLGPLRWIVGAPELHHWHHARVARTTHNFANLAPWLDLLFGTHHLPEGDETYELGLGEPWPRGYFAQLLQPFFELVGAHRRSSDDARPMTGPSDPEPARAAGAVRSL